MEMVTSNDNMINIQGDHENGFFVVTCNTVENKHTLYEIFTISENNAWCKAVEKVIRFLKTRNDPCYTLSEFNLMVELAYDIFSMDYASYTKYIEKE